MRPSQNQGTGRAPLSLLQLESEYNPFPPELSGLNLPPRLLTRSLPIGSGTARAAGPGPPSGSRDIPDGSQARLTSPGTSSTSCTRRTSSGGGDASISPHLSGQTPATSQAGLAYRGGNLAVPSSSPLHPLASPAFMSQSQAPDQSRSRSRPSHDEPSAHRGKRIRETDPGDDSGPAGDTQDLSSDGDDPSLATHVRACIRCKNLKVKCEVKSIGGKVYEPCTRCSKRGHECAIPGKKKRRPPPKRSDLMEQIQAQGAQIKQLMAQLEAQNIRTASLSSTSSASVPGLSMSQAPSPGSSTGPGADQIARAGSADDAAVQTWFTSARRSLDQYGGLVGIGGAGSVSGLLVDQDLEDSPSEEDEEDGWSTEASTGERRGAKKMATIPPEASPFGLMAKLAMKDPMKRMPRGDESSADESEGDEAEVGVAVPTYFEASPTADPLRAYAKSGEQELPHILSRGMISPVEGEQLFQEYYNYMNLSVSLLDPLIYTAQKTCIRSPFLFTVVCAIASRHYPSRPDLYLQLMEYAQLAAGTALISGQKSVELVHAYILLALYPVPARRWEDDRSWVYLGLAIRIAMDLNLHHPPTAKPINEQHSREMLNRTRAWVNCFNLDRSTSSMYGKPSIIRNDDYVANHSDEWWRASAFSLSGFDIHLCGYNAELRCLARFRNAIYSDPNHPTGLNKDADFQGLAAQTDDELCRLEETWMQRIQQTVDPGDPQACFRTGLLRLAHRYARLVALSAGLQHTFGKGNPDEGSLLQRCLRAASDVATVIVEDIGRPTQRVFLRHGPEAQSVFTTFACAFLIKLLQPKFSLYVTATQREEIRTLVEQVIDLLGSPEVAIDARHGPFLYSRFLSRLLNSPLVKDSPTGARRSLPSSRGRSPPAPYPQTQSHTLSHAHGHPHAHAMTHPQPLVHSQPHTHAPPHAHSMPLPLAVTPVAPPASMSYFDVGYTTLSPTMALPSPAQLAPRRPSGGSLYSPAGAESYALAEGAVMPSTQQQQQQQQPVPSPTQHQHQHPQQMHPHPHQQSQQQQQQQQQPWTGGAQAMILPQFFQPPLPFEAELLQSMQSLSDPSMFQDTSLPGFAWIGPLLNAPPPPPDNARVRNVTGGAGNTGARTGWT